MSDFCRRHHLSKQEVPKCSSISVAGSLLDESPGSVRETPQTEWFLPPSWTRHFPSCHRESSVSSSDLKKHVVDTENAVLFMSQQRCYSRLHWFYFFKLLLTVEHSHIHLSVIKCKTQQREILSKLTETVDGI